ncbi:rubrerythrin family protein [Halorientalis salina]|uniref:rubrerythrin family protein n=1 Tax=Halorientalis salina TaxID=2932266 RepID=UPI0010AC7F92|nr:rubrerythrin family protein [Halorientalis salina]
MDTDAFLDAVRDETKTELSRLGSSKSLYADTEGEMDEGPVLAAVADHLHHAAETFGTWADEADGAAGDCFADLADTVGEQYGTVADEHGDHEPGEAPAMVEYLAGLETTTERLAGVVGWALVTEHKIGQAVGFFVGQASPQTASTFREVRGAVEDAIDAGAETLTEVCDGDDDWDLAQGAAVETIEAAYDEYFDTLEALGVNPKPVC